MTSLTRRLKQALPARPRAWAHAVRRWAVQTPPVRDALFDARDGLDWVLGTRHPLVPPRKLTHGIGSSLDVGRAYLRHFRELAGLRPTDAVLDVGCGIGRMAVPLAGYLRPPGRYDGFDILRANVAWCRRAVTPRFPHFRFRHADVFSREYNPRGRLAGSSFRFPYPDESFDFAFLTSVFTHLLPADAAHYLAELGRVLRPGGRCLATFFLMTPESVGLTESGRGTVGLRRFAGPAWVSDPAVPEACLALDEDFVLASAAAAGLTLHGRPAYGSWCGRPAFTDYQDIVVFSKPGGGA
jgi:SAM-dependent methyltransferase